MKRDVGTAYIASAARVGSWAIISAMVFRWEGAAAFAILAFVRGTLGILNYASVGLGPAMVRLLAAIRQTESPLRAEPIGQITTALSYAAPDRIDLRTVYANGVAWSLVAAAIGMGIVVVYLKWIAGSGQLFIRAYDGNELALYMGIGIILRLVSDAPSAVLQTNNLIWLDNLLVALCEAAWPVLAVGIRAEKHEWSVAFGSSFGLASGMLAVTRFVVAEWVLRREKGMRKVRWWRQIRGDLVLQILTFGALVSVAQLADFLYAPMDYILINWLLNPATIAAYAPAIQIDAGLLLLVSGLAAVLLPKAALADAAGDARALRRYYVRGTVLGTLVLVVASALVWAASSWLFLLWFKDAMPATRAILPLVLVHTVIGGSSAVGRSILLGMGKVRAFTIAVLVAGVLNVIFSYCFVKFFHLGLVGIILGTIVVVVGRCAVWMPWYVNKALREAHGRISVEQGASGTVTPVV